MFTATSQNGVHVSRGRENRPCQEESGGEIIGESLPGSPARTQRPASPSSNECYLLNALRVSFPAVETGGVGPAGAVQEEGVQEEGECQ